MAGVGDEADHLSQSSAEVKNERSCTSTLSGALAEKLLFLTQWCIRCIRFSVTVKQSHNVELPIVHYGLKFCVICGSVT